MRTGGRVPSIEPMPDTLPNLLRSRRLLVLDFDGPVTRLLPGDTFRHLTAGARELAVSRGVPLDDELAEESDHVQLLRLIARRDPAAGLEAERWCTAQEVAAAQHARPVPAARELVSRCRERGVAVAVVTNNAPASVTPVLAHGGPLLAGLSVHGRRPGRLEELKPAPDMLLAAAREARLQPQEAAMVGDSTTDVQAAAAAAMPCIGLSPDPERRAELRAAGAVAVVPDLAAVLAATP